MNIIMADYTNQEYTDMNLKYGRAEGDEYLAQWLHK